MTLLIVSFLAFKNKPSLVEMKVTVRSASFMVLPPAEAEGDAGGPVPSALLPAQEISLFPSTLSVEVLEVKDADCVETTLDGIGPVALRTEPGGSVVVRTDGPFHPELVLREPTPLTLEITGRDKVTIWLEQRRAAESPVPQGRIVTASSSRSLPCTEPAGADQGWSGFLPPGDGLFLKLRDVQATGPAETALTGFSELEPYRVPPDATRFRITGGGRDSRLSLALPHPPGPSSVFRVLDPETGEVSEPKTLPFTLSEPRSLPWKDRLVLIDPVPAGDRPVSLLRSDLKIQDLELARHVQLEAKSFVVEGEVRFPSGEKEPIKLEADSFVSLAIDPGQPLVLRSFDFSNQGLEMLVWGEPTSLRIGPTPESRVERLPSYFEWLLTHRLGGLVYGTLAYVSALSLAVFKLLGWFKG